MSAKKINRKKLAKEIIKRLDKGEPVEKISRQIAAFLIDSGRTSELNSLMRDLVELRASQNGIIEATATTAFPLNAQEKSEVEDFAKGYFDDARRIILHDEHDPDVIGGISLTLANSLLDGTIRAKLNRLRALTS